jgi:hypothetical protein
MGPGAAAKPAGVRGPFGSPARADAVRADILLIDEVNTSGATPGRARVV